MTADNGVGSDTEIDEAAGRTPGMDGSAFRDALEDEKRTELDRLGSSKLLIALTDADLRPAAVLSRAAHSELAARTIVRVTAADGTTGIAETYGDSQVIDGLEEARTRRD